MSSSYPEHIAIIMDGNGRWAKQRNLSRSKGHKEGVKTTKKIIEYSAKIDIKYLTLYAFSAENWKRPRREVSFLMNLFNSTIDRELDDLIEKNVKVKFIGRREGLGGSIRRRIENAEKKTKDGKKLVLTVALNYGGRKEIVDAVKNLIKDEISAEQIDEETFSKYLYTSGTPDPDLVIRTSGEYRISNYLLWQIAYSELYITDVLWPDFDEKELDRAIKDYKSRNRRFGSIN
ncbi:MAG: isoprenyl transferase [Candidatus Mcinerneyibacterium aminivorans]|uniref:Isoprenyl transferase n=1 Tax=Candidatus Mcinerneyibacterium aminivorans TaxID=2703815 RepID=A0A5D0MCE2_9BACT|nr:MAG: isoprenyl transferase [Candidatus Mcinerneyibacterium aminivorans]